MKSNKTEGLPDSQEAILIVMKSLAIAGVLEAMLEKEGYRPVLASEEHVQTFSWVDQADAYVLILLDVDLNGALTDPLEIIRQVEKRWKAGWALMPPTILFTTQTRSRFLLEEAGHIVFLKPFSVKGVLQEIKALLSTQVSKDLICLD